MCHQSILRRSATRCYLLAPAIVVCASVGIRAQTAEHDWSCSALAYTYIVPDEWNYVQPTFIADREKLHLEARYGYEDRKTGSTWMCCPSDFGDAR
jgi:hypothetical protein